MRTDREIAVARHMVAAHDANYPMSPFQRAVLYGMKTTLGFNKFQLPKQRESWTLLIRKMCEQYTPETYKDFRHQIPRLTEAKTSIDWALLREIATKVLEWYEVPPLHQSILSGMRIACAWILELPAGGKALEELYNGAVTEAAIGLNPRLALYAGPNGAAS